jgi:hypothetical protein
MIMHNRSEGEIVARIQESERYDMFGTTIEDLALFLPFDKAKQFLRDDLTSAEFEAAATKLKPPLVDMKAYLDFAWTKANGCRGLSAMRSLLHMRAWLWLAGWDKLADADDFNKYNHYGKAQLVMCSLITDFDWRKADDGAWVNREGDLPLRPHEIESKAAWAATTVEKYRP